MPIFTPLHEQEPVPLPDDGPVLSLGLGEGLNPAGISEVRHSVVGYIGSEVVRAYIGRPVPRFVLEAVDSCLAELLSNAQRKERVATGVYVWASHERVEVGVGDNTAEIEPDDERPQTITLPSDIDGAAPEINELDTLLAELEEHGLGGSVLEEYADAVSHSIVPTTTSTSMQERKIVRARIDIPAQVNDEPILCTN